MSVRVIRPVFVRVKVDVFDTIVCMFVEVDGATTKAVSQHPNSDGDEQKPHQDFRERLHKRRDDELQHERQHTKDED